MRPARLLSWLLAATVIAVPAQASDRLDATGFVDVGDRLADVLTTSGLAFTTLQIGRAATESGARLAGLSRPRSAQVDDSACAGGGSVRVETTDADGDGALSVGDRIATEFRRCAMDSGVVSGRSAFVVAVHRFEGRVELTELEFQFDELGTDDLRWTGAARVSLRTDLLRGTERYGVQYRDLAVLRHGRPMRWGFHLELTMPPIGEQVARLDGPITLGGLRLDLKQHEPFVIARDGAPRSGVVEATDPRGARLQLEAGRRRYAYRWFAPGNRGERADAVSTSRPHGAP